MKGAHPGLLADELERSSPQRALFEAGWPDPFVVVLGNNPADASLFDRPDFPRDGVASLGGVPEPVEIIAGRQHPRSSGRHEGIDIDGHEVVLLDEDTLDRLDQPLPLFQVGAALVFGPEFLDLGLTHEGRRPPTDGIDTHRVLSTPRPRANDLQNGPVARIPLTALAELGPIRGALQHLQFAANAGGA
jgi:hypothetical protein